MKFYLSSFKFGDSTEALKKAIPTNNKIGHINNARDYIGRNPESAERHQREEINYLNQLGFEAESLDLKLFFNEKDKLSEKLNELGGLWISGGNTFVLNQAMKLSGFKELFPNLVARKDFLYAGYSAGACILADNLTPIDQVDDPLNFPYPEITTPLYNGLGFFPYVIISHYDSKHPETDLVQKAIQRCINNKWLFKAMRDGEVLLIDEE